MVPVVRLKAKLDGAQEVPPVETRAEGTARLFFIKGDDHRDLLLVQLSVRNIKNVFAAHIHLAAPGVNGPVVLGLFGPTDPVDIGRETQIVNRAFTCDDLVGPFKGRSLDTLLRAALAGNTYVNVHTVQNFNGEIRGQIFPVYHHPRAYPQVV